MEYPYLITTGAATAILSVLLCWFVHSRLRSRRARKRCLSGLGAERQAYRYLQQHGFSIVETQPVIKGTMWLDDQALTYTVRADYLVRKRGKKSLVEVKSGNAADPKTRRTRRQLFEYAHLYRVQRVYLFDAQQSRLIRIRFAKQAAHSYRKTILHVVIGAMCALLLVYRWL